MCTKHGFWQSLCFKIDLQSEEVSHVCYIWSTKEGEGIIIFKKQVSHHFYQVFRCGGGGADPCHLVTRMWSRWHWFIIVSKIGKLSLKIIQRKVLMKSRINCASRKCLHHWLLICVQILMSIKYFCTTIKFVGSNCIVRFLIGSPSKSIPRSNFEMLFFVIMILTLWQYLSSFSFSVRFWNTEITIALVSYSPDSFRLSFDEFSPTELTGNVITWFILKRTIESVPAAHTFHQFDSDSMNKRFQNTFVR